jgi:acyl dehydratase
MAAVIERNLRVFANIESLQADFPGFVIWGETIRGRVTHVAQAPDRHISPRELGGDRERQAEAALGVGPPFP